MKIYKIMKIYKTIKGEKFDFNLKLIPFKMKCEIKWFKTDDPILCDISKDMNYIIVPEKKLYVIKETEKIYINNFKINNRLKIDVEDYNKR